MVEADIPRERIDGQRAPAAPCEDDVAAVGRDVRGRHRLKEIAGAVLAPEAAAVARLAVEHQVYLLGSEADVRPPIGARRLGPEHVAMPAQELIDDVGKRAQ